MHLYFLTVHFFHFILFFGKTKRVLLFQDDEKQIKLFSEHGLMHNNNCFVMVCRNQETLHLTFSNCKSKGEKHTKLIMRSYANKN